MADYSQYQLGSLLFPLTASTANSLFQDADPTLYHLIRFFSASLTTNVGDRWNAECARVEGFNSFSGSLVKRAVPYEAAQRGMTTTQFPLPLLCMYRTRERVETRTRAWDEAVSTVQLDFIFPPMDNSQRQRLEPFAHAVAGAIQFATKQGFMPDYLNGRNIFDFANVSSIELEGFTYGTLPGATTNVYLPTVSARFQVGERDSFVTGSLSDLEGIDFDIDLVTSASLSGSVSGTVDAFVAVSQSLIF